MPTSCVDFVLDGNDSGSVMTDANGVATLTGVTTTDAAGTYPGAVAASFAGETKYLGSQGTGTLTVSSS